MIAHALSLGAPAPALAPTPRDVLRTVGCSRLLRFRGSRPPPGDRAPVLIVPSLINRWYVVDLRPGASLVAALVEDGHDVYCLDWGVPRDEDRFLEWDEVLVRLRRAVRWTQRHAQAERVALLGYCMGATLAAIHGALHPDTTAALVDLAGPIDFSHAGILGHFVDRRWFSADAIADAGNVSPEQMQSGFVALRPTAQLAKWWALAERGHEPHAREAFSALEAWADDNVPFPAAAYRRYIGELYQDNALVRGTHHVAGRRVDLAQVRCPVLVITASRDAICPPPAALALRDHVGTTDTTHLQVPGGHVGAVVGSRATSTLYPALSAWLTEKTARP